MLGGVIAAAVLAVTSDPETQDHLFELAVTDGFGLRCAATPGEATDLLQREAPGLLLVDLDLPGRAAFLRSFRQGPHGDIPCVAVTATNDPMLAVSIDAPVFYKPELEGFDAAVARLFSPIATSGGSSTRRQSR